VEDADVFLPGDHFSEDVNCKGSDLEGEGAETSEALSGDCTLSVTDTFEDVLVCNIFVELDFVVFDEGEFGDVA
jgi:hypothetical protein